MNAQAELEKTSSIPVPVFGDLKEQKHCAPSKKLSRLQRRILLGILEGESKVEERARQQEQANACVALIVKSFNKCANLPKRVKRGEIEHLSRREILADYFGINPRKIPEPEEHLSALWWRDQPLAALNNPAFARAKVKDLGRGELESVLEQWCPQVKAAWDRVGSQTRQLYEAIMEAKVFFERKVRYNRANPAICRALRRLRARGLVAAAGEDSLIRLTPKGRKIARKLASVL
jgi:hypothetical protein